MTEWTGFPIKLGMTRIRSLTKRPYKNGLILLNINLNKVVENYLLRTKVKFEMTKKNYIQTPIYSSALLTFAGLCVSPLQLYQQASHSVFPKRSGV